MLVALAVQPLAQPGRAQQVDGRLLQDARPDPARDVLLRAGLHDHRLHPLGGQQVREQHAGRPGADDRDLGAQVEWPRGMPVSEAGTAVTAATAGSAGRKRGSAGARPRTVTVTP